MASAAMKAVGSVSGNQPRVQRIIENAAQTFESGTPLQIDAASGSLEAWDGSTVTRGIAGISTEGGANLTTAGVAETENFGSVPYQASAVNIPRGAPLNDGMTGCEVAAQDTVFEGEMDSSITVDETLIGDHYGMTIDSDGHWYIDSAKTTIGTNTVCVIVGISEYNTRGVRFIFEQAVQALGA